MSLSRSKPHVAPFVGPAWYLAAVWLGAAIVAQATVVHYFAVRDVVPSLVLVVVVWYSIRVNALRAGVYGLVAGLCEDALSAQTGAAWMISTSVCAVLASVLSRGFFADSIPLAAAVTIVATLVRALLFWVVMASVGYPPGLGVLHFHHALFESALNVVVMVAAMAIARRLEAAAP